MAFERKTLPEQHYLYVDRECPYGPEIGPAMGSAFSEVEGFLAEHGITPLDAPMSVYLEMDPKVLRFRGARIVSAEDAAKADGAVRADRLPAGVAIKATHLGGYDNLNVTHRALWDYMETEGIPAAWPIWEIYVDDPGTTRPDDLRTEIYRATG